MAVLTELVFTWHESDNHACLIRYEYHWFLKTFYAAKEDSCTFGEFWAALGEYGRQYVTPFILEDEFPRMDDLLEEIEQDYFILDDGTFPLMQCAEETYREIQELIPDSYCKQMIRTEYGKDIGFFHVSDFVLIKDLLDCNQFILSTVKSPFPVNFHFSDDGAFIR